MLDYEITPPARYSIDAYDPARFNDIHALLHAGNALLYAARVAQGQVTSKSYL